jgi:hypothetical protein
MGMEEEMSEIKLSRKQLKVLESLSSGASLYHMPIAKSFLRSLFLGEEEYWFSVGDVTIKHVDCLTVDRLINLRLVVSSLSGHSPQWTGGVVISEKGRELIVKGGKT